MIFNLGNLKEITKKPIRTNLHNSIAELKTTNQKFQYINDKQLKYKIRSHIQEPDKVRNLNNEIK